MFSVYNNSTDDNSGVSFGLFPEGLGVGATTDTFQRAFSR